MDSCPKHFVDEFRHFLLMSVRLKILCASDADAVDPEIRKLCVVVTASDGDAMGEAIRDP